jgi:hypothetical protein
MQKGMKGKIFMKTNIDREAALALLKKYISTRTVYLHSIESEAVMIKLAEKLKATHNEVDIDVDFWGTTALLHDLDSDRTIGDLSRHGFETVELLKKEGYDIPEMFRSIISHTEALGVSDAKRTHMMDYALAASENITGIISAYVKMRPTKTVQGVKVKSITKKLKDRSFAASVNRDFINDVEEYLGIERSKFLKISIEAMTRIADQTGM